jgi:hypothetical protein
MMAIALGVLVLTALVTAGLARRTEVTTARHDVQDRAAVVAPEFYTLIRQLPAAKAATGTVAGRRQIRRIRDLVNTTLRASNGAVVAVDANGDVQEVLGRLLGTAGDTPTLPDGVSIDDLDPRSSSTVRRRAMMATSCSPARRGRLRRRQCSCSRRRQHLAVRREWLRRRRRQHLGIAASSLASCLTCLFAVETTPARSPAATSA